MKKLLVIVSLLISVTSGVYAAPPEKDGKTIFTSKLHPAYLPVTLDNHLFFAVLFCSIGLLVLALLVFVRVKEWQRNGVDNNL